MYSFTFRFPRFLRVFLLFFFVAWLPEYSGAEVPPPDFDLKGNPVTLEKVIDLAIAHNPVLSASRWERRAMAGRVIQAGLLPNPEIEAETENFAGSGVFSGFDAAETKVQLNQLIELGGKRAKRSAYAALGRDLAQWDYEVTRATLAFMKVLFAQERLGHLLPIPSLKALETMVTRNPDVGRWAVAIEQHRAAVDLEEANGIPDLTVSLAPNTITHRQKSGLAPGVHGPVRWSV